MPVIAWRPLVGLSTLISGLFVALGGRYGYHRDELYYLVAGGHPAWGYDDQPPLAPILARAMDALAPGNLTVLRLPSALAVGAIALLTGLIVAEMGGRRAAQLLAALVFGLSPVLAVAGHLLSTTVFDVLFWTTLAWLLLRWLRTRNDGYLYAVGPVAGLALLNKSLAGFWLFALLVAVAIVGPRELFRRPALWVSAAVAALMVAPNVWWQATHGWPQLSMGEVIRAQADPIGLLPMQILLLGPPIVFIWIAGLWRLWRGTFRLFAVAWVIVVALTIITGGREYYPVGAYAPLIAAGCIGTVDLATRRSRVVVLSVLASAQVLGSVALGLPVWPVAQLHQTPQPAVNYDSGETVGWPELTATVTDVYRGLSPAERAGAVILTSNYGQAGAIIRFGVELPPVYSRHNNFWRWGPPSEQLTGPVIVVGRWTEADLRQYCGDVVLAARHDNGVRLDNEEQGVPIWICRDKRGSWADLWPRLRRFA